MKNLFFLITVLFLIESQADGHKTPQLFFNYSGLYDSAVCPEKSTKKVDPAWAREADERTKEFAQIWGKAEPILFGKVFEIFGAGFSRKELTATLSACPIVPSYSDPLTLNVTRFLKSYMGEKPVASNEGFADLVFHELLHTWIVENGQWPSALYEKYQNEKRVVRNHLHLMAVQKHVYSELNRSDLILMIETRYKNMLGYDRAWQIVTEIEGIEPFLKELKK